MKIYIVTSGCYSDYQIEAVFETKEKAEIYCATKNKSRYDDYRIEVFETSDDDIEGDRKQVGYCYVFYRDAHGKYLEFIEPIIYTKSYFEQNYKNNTDYLWLNKKNNAKAKRIFEEREAQRKAESEGIT